MRPGTAQTRGVQASEKRPAGGPSPAFAPRINGLRGPPPKSAKLADLPREGGGTFAAFAATFTALAVACARVASVAKVS